MSETIGFSNIVNTIKKNKKPELIKDVPDNFYIIGSEKDPKKILEKNLRTFYILLNTANDLKVNKTLSQKEYNCFKNALNYLKNSQQLKGFFVKSDSDGNGSRTNINTVLDCLGDYVLSSTKSISDQEAQQYLKDYPNFFSILEGNNEQELNNNLNKLEGLLSSLNNPGDIKTLLSKEIKNALGQNPVTKEEREKFKVDPQSQNNSPESNGKTPSTETQEKIKQAIDQSLKGDNAIITDNSPYRLFTGFNYNTTRMLNKLRANKHYDFADEMEYFDKNIKEIEDFKKKIAEDKEKYPARVSQYEKVLKNIRKHLGNIIGFKEDCEKYIKKLTAVRYLSDSDWSKYVGKVLRGLSNLELETRKMESEYYWAGRPTKEEAKAAKQAIKDEARDKRLVNSVWGREVIKKFEDTKENLKYKNFVRKIRTVMDGSEIDDLIKKFTEAFNTRDQYGHITREALEKIWDIERIVKERDKALKKEDRKEKYNIFNDDLFKGAGLKYRREFITKEALDKIKMLSKDFKDDKKLEEAKKLLERIKRIAGEDSEVYKDAENIINPKPETPGFGSKIKEWVQNRINKKSNKKPENMNEDIIAATSIAIGVLFGVGLASMIAYGASAMITAYGLGVVKIMKATANIWRKFGREFTREDLEKKAKKIAESKGAQKVIEKIEKTNDRYYDELKGIYDAIEDRNWEEASESFKDLSRSLQNNPDIIKAIINKITEVVGEPPLYINSPGNETYQAIKKIINIQVAKSAAEAVRKAIE